MIYCYRNRRRSEINQSELQAIAAQHSQEGEEQGEELGSGDFHGNERGGDKEEDQRSLLGSSEDSGEIERDRNSESASSKRTVLHTYSVFISNIGSDKKCRVSNSTDQHHHHSNKNVSIKERGCSTSEAEHCHVDLKETDLVGNGGVIELPGDGSCSSREGGQERGEREEKQAAGRGREEVKVGWRGKAKRGIKTALVDLKLFLW